MSTHFAGSRCICGHAEHNHIFDPPSSICAQADCKCHEYIRWVVYFFCPIGEIRVVSNVSEFVRDNDYLFEWADTVEKHSPSAARETQKFTNASLQLSHLAEGYIQSWKGWTVMTYPKTYEKV